ncbi:GAF domain-containing protein [Gordonia sp. zg691]|uniref:LuxR C-terminal-related transcriptional regulator n=1 Tax=Gordonia jinghuaiqii TaxID=2758710 RepID=UPI0016626582|nr:LuxR C-terminal-related transcriptional regulator [Gordonia jinghuaiqii]MBD0860358.1 GAF domain-containing protein [Gordonia jinghuaiqii]
MDGQIDTWVSTALDSALGPEGTVARDQLVVAASEDEGALGRVRSALLTQLRGGGEPGRMRAAAELLIELEVLRRRDTERRLANQRAQIAGLRAVLTGLAQVPPNRRPYAVTQRLCEDMGFRKAVYSPASVSGWSPTTIAYHPDLGRGFAQLSRAIEDLSLPRGAAPREEEVMRSGRAIAVDPADVYRETYRPLVELSRPRGYLVVPIVAAGRVTGVLHADHHDIELQESDLRSLENAATIYGMAEERDAIRTVIATRGAQAADAITALRAALHELERSRLNLADVLGSDSPHERSSVAGDAQFPCAVLTDREHQIFDLVATGTTNADIAHSLIISESTVKSHVKRVYRKLGIGTRAEAAALHRRAHRSAQ